MRFSCLVRVANSQSTRVLIVGGGMGGLALANGLSRLQPSVSFRVFERDSQMEARRQGYQLGLQKFGSEALFRLHCENTVQTLLDRYDTLTNMCIAKTTSKSFESMLCFSVGKGGGVIDRGSLRTLLSEPADVQKNLVWGKKVTRFELLEDAANPVVVHFEDGSSEAGDILIGCDGARSLLRKQLYPTLDHNAFMFDTQVSSFPLSVDVARLRALNDAGVNQLLALADKTLVRVLGPGGNTWLFMIYKEEHGAKKGEEILTMVLNFNVKVDGDFPSKGTPEQWLQFAGNRARGCAALEALVSALRPEHIILGGPKHVWTSDHALVKLLPKFRLQHSQSHRVILLGDAVHAMTTHRGLGANTAFVDAQKCYDLIRSNWSREGALALEQDICNRGSKAVMESLQSTNMLHMQSNIGRTLRNAVIRVLGFIIPKIQKT